MASSSDRAAKLSDNPNNELNQLSENSNASNANSATSTNVERVVEETVILSTAAPRRKY